MNKKPLNRMMKKFLSTPKLTPSVFQRENTPQRHLVGGSIHRRPNLTLTGDDAKAVKGEPGSHVSLSVKGIITSAEGSPREKPNKVIAVEKVRQSRRPR